MVRNATEQDIQAILDLSREFWKFTRYTEAFDEETTLPMIILSMDHDLMLVNEVDGRVNGFLAAIKAPLLASSEAMQAVELAWYIEPQKRGGAIGIRLIQEMETKAREQGIKYFNMASMQSSMPDVINRMYDKMDYVHSETIYTKIL